MRKNPASDRPDPANRINGDLIPTGALAERDTVRQDTDKPDHPVAVRPWPEGFLLRTGGLPDAQSMAVLDALCFTIPWTEEMFCQELSVHNQAHYLVLEQEKAGVIGYGGYWQVLDEAQIMNIAVHPLWRGHGLATVLLTTLIDLARKSDLKWMSLEVREGNEPARRLYSRLGFEQVGLRRGYYADNGENAIIMLKNIVQTDGKFV